jgi:N-acetylmuramic acid-specific PTS system IIC component
MGSMLGVIMACIASIYVERFLNKIIHQSVGFVFVPVLTILILLILNFLLFFPISGYFILGLSWLFEHITTGQGAPFGDAILAGLYLFLLTFGLSSSLIPVYTMLLQNGGLNTIYPLLGMAGFGQIGAAVALYLVASKGSNYRKTIKSSIISGFLGIDEPLCYGMSIPKLVPFVTSCISATCAGFFIGGMQA